MSETPANVDKAVLGQAESVNDSSVGAVLRKAREAQGLQIAMLAVQLKVPVSRIEALEADRYEEFPDTIMLRALAGSISRALKVDADMVLAALPPSLVPVIKSDKNGLNTVFNSSANGYGRSLRSALSKPMGIAIVLLMLGIFAIIFFPPVLPIESAGTVPAADPGQTTNSQFPPSYKAEAVVATTASAPQLTVATSFSLSDPVPATVAIAPPNQVASSSSTSNEQVNLVSTTAASRGSELLALQAEGASWVEVLDAKGAVLLRTTLKRGDFVPVTGVPPLAVVLGRADLVKVFVRGQNFDTTAMTNVHVARFEVK